MPFTAAERMRRYREKLKLNPEKYEEHKKKHAKLVKEKTKKITQLPDKERDELRKKWREQKQKQKKKKAEGERNSTNNTPKIKKGNNKARHRSRIARQYKAALNKIDALKKVLQTTRKQYYRYKVKSVKEIEQLQESVTKMKVRGEVLESSLKSAYEKCRTLEQKRLIKSFVDNEKVAAAKMKTQCSGILGLKGKIRKSKKRVRSVKASLEIETFFTRDDISRCTAGKKECRTLQKNKEQIRYLTDTLQILYQKYKSEGGKYSFSTFFKHKPFFVLSPNVKNRDTCLCIKHSNIELLLCALQKKGVLSNYKSMTHILKQLSCDLDSYSCMYSTCQICKKVALDYQLKEGQIDLNVEWFQWERIDHKYEKNENGSLKTVTTKKSAKVAKTGTIGTLIKKFENDILAFKKHYFTWIHQQRQYQKCLNDLKENEALIICDFSENYQCKMASEVQSMHFGAAKEQITLHTGMVYWRDASQSFCTVAASNCHEPQAIWAHLLPVIKLVRETKPTTSIIHFFSDGPSSQYRQKKNFFLHNFFTCKLGLDYSTWSFSESGHGKGVADGIGGAVKRALDRQVAYGRDITGAQDAFEMLQKCMKTVKCLLINNTDIENIYKILPKTLKTVPGTMQIHQISSRSRDIITHRTHSCFCSSERGLGGCYSPQHYCFGLNNEPKRGEIRHNQIYEIANDKVHKTETTVLDMKFNEKENEIKSTKDKKSDAIPIKSDAMSDKDGERGITEVTNSMRSEKEKKTRDGKKDNGDEKFHERRDEIIDKKYKKCEYTCDKDNEREITEESNLMTKEKENKTKDRIKDNRDEKCNERTYEKSKKNNEEHDATRMYHKGGDRETTEETPTEYVILCDENMNSRVNVSPKIFPLETDITKKKSFNCSSQMKVHSKLDTEKYDKKRKSSEKDEYEHMNNDKKRIRFLDNTNFNPQTTKCTDLQIRKPKQSVRESLKCIVKRTVICYVCKTELPFQVCTVKCIACKNLICLSCSQGQQISDYICDTCFGE